MADRAGRRVHARSIEYVLGYHQRGRSRPGLAVWPAVSSERDTGASAWHLNGTRAGSEGVSDSANAAQHEALEVSAEVSAAGSSTASGKQGISVARQGLREQARSVWVTARAAPPATTQ
jgi:hypothetical protein